MQMTEERLQEINEEILYAKKRPLEFPLVHIAKELVAAVEQAQADRDGAIKREADQFAKDRDKLDNLRKQLATILDWINANPLRKRAYELDTRWEDDE